jgi:hypothetical protein
MDYTDTDSNIKFSKADRMVKEVQDSAKECGRTKKIPIGRKTERREGEEERGVGEEKYCPKTDGRTKRTASHWKGYCLEKNKKDAKIRRNRR